MDDNTTTLQQIKDKVKKFVEERDWGQYHNPKNLAMALAVECAELMEIYQWLSSEESLKHHEDPENRKKIEEELADICVYLIDICNELNIDLSDAIKRKMKINAEKYPIDLAKGKSDKYTELE